MKRFRNKKLSHKGVLEYWKNCTDSCNSPERYAKNELEPRSELVYKLINRISRDKDLKILEVGCNVGRNLNYLFTRGYLYLTGIELSYNALEIGKLNYPLLFANCRFIPHSIENVTRDLDKFDIIFTLATLEHIHKKVSKKVFDSIAKHTKYIITIEDEKTNSPRHFPRNYKKIFERRGFKQISEKGNLGYHYLSTGFIARVFKKKG